MEAINVLKGLAVKRTRKKYPNVPIHAIPSPKYSDKTSNGLTKCIIDFIQLKGYQAERINSMGRQIDKRQTVTDILGNKKQIGSLEWVPGTTTKGTADISATIQGRAVKIEVKCRATGDRYQSKYQKAYQESIEKAGGVYIIARDFQGFYEWFKEFVKL